MPCFHPFFYAYIDHLINGVGKRPFIMSLFKKDDIKPASIACKKVGGADFTPELK
jgi:hypothetical protein